MLLFLGTFQRTTHVTLEEICAILAFFFFFFGDGWGEGGSSMHVYRYTYFAKTLVVNNESFDMPEHASSR